MADVANPTVTVNQPHSASSRAGIAWKKSWLHSMSAFAVVFNTDRSGATSISVHSVCVSLASTQIFFVRIRCLSDSYNIWFAWVLSVGSQKKWDILQPPMTQNSSVMSSPFASYGYPVTAPKWGWGIHVNLGKL